MAKPNGSGASSPVAESRAESFMRSALDILGETGGTDFTVLDVVQRSKTSLRAFYQHFSTKDELLLALVERIMVDATKRWRTETAEMSATDALRRLVERISAPAHSSTQDSINRGLSYYNDHLLQTRPREFALVLRPLHELVVEILRRGVTEGAFRADLDLDADAAILTQSILGALRLRDLGTDLTGTVIESDHVFTFCLRGLTTV